MIHFFVVDIGRNMPITAVLRLKRRMAMIRVHFHLCNGNKCAAFKKDPLHGGEILPHGQIMTRNEFGGEEWHSAYSPNADELLAALKTHMEAQKEAGWQFYEDDITRVRREVQQKLGGNK